MELCNDKPWSGVLDWLVWCPCWGTIHGHFRKVSACHEECQTQNLYFNLYFQSQSISFLSVTEVLDEHGQKKADICKLRAFNKHLDPTTNIHVRGRDTRQVILGNQNYT